MDYNLLVEIEPGSFMIEEETEQRSNTVGSDLITPLGFVYSQYCCMFKKHQDEAKENLLPLVKDLSSDAEPTLLTLSKRVEQMEKFKLFFKENILDLSSLESGEADSVNLEQTQIAISPEVNSNNISGHTANASDNAPSSDVSQPIRTDPKSSEDKTVDDFLDLKEKERVSNTASILLLDQKNIQLESQHKESKLRVSDSSIASRQTSAESEQMSINQKIPYNQKVEQGLM
ncbi:1476_t:CDS:2, partial [Entrophospora sp. SA101]